MITAGLRKALGVAAFLALWALVSYTRWLPRISLATPTDTFGALGTLFTRWGLQRDLAATLARTVVAFALSGFLGIAAGLVVGASEKLRQVFAWPIEFVRAIPVTALLPISIAFFGIGDTSKVALATIGCALIVLVNTAHGAQQASQLRVRVAEGFGARRAQVFRHVILPEALPQIIAGLRVALSMSLVLIVVTEMFSGTRVGVGKRINDFHLTFQTGEMYASILVVGAVGLVLNQLFIAVHRRTSHWVEERFIGR